MSDNTRPDPIDVTGVRYGTVEIRDAIHFTGGIRALRARGGWRLGPTVEQGTLSWSSRPLQPVQLAPVADHLGLVMIAGEETSNPDSLLPAWTWTPFDRPGVPLRTADTWSMIGTAARMAGDTPYANLALSIASTVRAAGLQVRRASCEYHSQLVAAVHDRIRPGMRFSNTRIAELHLSFHSIVAELASARDYIATLAARRVGAPSKIDALNRLADWAGKSANSGALNDPLISHLLEISNPERANCWLFDIGEYRNFLLHRQPMGVQDSAYLLSLYEASFGQIPVFMLRLEINNCPDDETRVDALTRFVGLHNELCRLADFASGFATYRPTMQHFRASE